MSGLIAQLIPVVVTVVLGLIAWWVTERFSPDPLVTKIVQVIIFVVVLYVVVTRLLGVH